MNTFGHHDRCEVKGLTDSTDWYVREPVEEAIPRTLASAPERSLRDVGAPPACARTRTEPNCMYVPVACTVVPIARICVRRFVLVLVSTYVVLQCVGRRPLLPTVCARCACLRPSVPHVRPLACQTKRLIEVWEIYFLESPRNPANKIRVAMASRRLARFSRMKPRLPQA